MSQTIDLSKCKPYVAGQFTGYKIGYIQNGADYQVPNSIRELNELSAVLDSDKIIVLPEKQRIVSALGGRINRFSQCGYATVIGGPSYTLYVFIVGELPTELNTEIITQLVNLVEAGYPFSIRYSEVTAEQYETLQQYFHIKQVDEPDEAGEKGFVLYQTKPGFGDMILMAAVWPFVMTYDVGAFVNSKIRRLF